jgi:hypothetical protein
MPRTVPTVGGTPSYVLVTMRYIDANGTKDAQSLRTTLARATNAAVEAWVAKVAAASNANVYEVNIQSIYTANTASPAAATEAPRESAKDVIETLEKDVSSGKTQYSYIPAPLDAMFLAGTQTVDITNTTYTDVNAAVDTLLPTTYAPISVRFAEHKLTAEKTNI